MSLINDALKRAQEDKQRKESEAAKREQSSAASAGSADAAQAAPAADAAAASPDGQPDSGLPAGDSSAPAASGGPEPGLVAAGLANQSAQRLLLGGLPGGDSGPTPDAASVPKLSMMLSGMAAGADSEPDRPRWRPAVLVAWGTLMLAACGLGLWARSAERPRSAEASDPAAGASVSVSAANDAPATPTTDSPAPSGRQSRGMPDIEDSPASAGSAERLPLASGPAALPRNGHPAGLGVAGGPTTAPADGPLPLAAPAPPVIVADVSGEALRPAAEALTGTPEASGTPQTQPDAAAPAKPPAPRFALSGIMRRGGAAPMATINGRLVTVGDSIDGAKVLDIGQRSVELEADGQQFTVRM